MPVNGKKTLKKLLTVAAFAIAGAGFATGASAKVQGSCEGYFEHPDAVGDVLEDGSVDRNDPIPVIRFKTKVYEEASDSSKVTKTVEFGDRLFLRSLKDGYYQVATDGRDEFVEETTLGWVQGDNLLCRSKPVQNENGIARKFYIRTKASFVDGEATTLKPTAGPETKECSKINERCRELSRFTLYYVFALDEVNKKVLLLSRHRSEGDTPLIGWVSMEDGYLWDTRFGLRPKEDLTFDKVNGTWAVGEERRACLYETLELADKNADSDVCYVPILGGNRWFNYALRIPVFDRVEYKGKPYYHVAMPTSGVGSNAADDVLSQVKGLDEAIRLLKNLSSLDVFFLLDGTQSMQPHIDTLRGVDGKPGVLEAIQKAFDKDPRFRDVNVRYGYRVYRDHYAGNEGMGEAMPFDTNCAPTKEDLDANHSKFQSEIRKIDTEFGTGGERDTDHEENLILGLAFAADDMSACRENVKLLFVVGDTGYDKETLAKRGGSPVSESDVLEFMTHGASAEDDPVIPFFIQVPKVESKLNLTGDRLQNYLDAYAKFTDQGKFFVEKIGDHFNDGAKNKDSDIKISEHFYSLDGSDLEEAQTKLVEFVLSRVSEFGDQRPINEVIAELQGGTALVNIISALSEGKKTSVPAVRLAQIEKRICDELGKACEERVFNDITEGYIPADEDVKLDIWVESEEFAAWRAKLDLIKDTTQYSPTELSQVIVKMMVDGVKNSTGDLSPSEMNMSIAEFLKLKHGLPVGQQTPLLNYSLGDFIHREDVSTDSRDLIEVCELYRVARWLYVHREIFASVETSEVPIFELNEGDKAACEMRHATPEVKMGDRQPFPEDTMSYRKVQTEESIVWLPNDFLP